ncbi:MAG: hypothetical protein VKK04_02685 [Synechococcales bacterium]|nr:hypothetical protein [Synechococcales bacterium]
MCAARNLYRRGDIVAATHRFEKCGCVLETEGDRYLVDIGQTVIPLREDEMLLVSIKNIANQRLVAERLEEVGGDRLSPDVRQSLLDFTLSGTIAARAFADYVIKVPHPILATCLDKIQALAQTCPQSMPDTISAVLNINFRLLSMG